MEAKEALGVTHQQVAGVEEDVPGPEDIGEQLSAGQLRAPRVAQERGLLAHRGHQQPWLTWQSHRVRSGLAWGPHPPVPSSPVSFPTPPG